jgi:hypothetical protein
MQRPDLIVQALVATLFVVACAALIALGFEGPVDLVDLVLLVAVAAVLGRLEFEIGSGFASPIQLVFIPMLFVLPPAIVPPAFAAALVLDRIPAVLTRRSHPRLLLTALGDAWFAIGPAIVFAVAGLDVPSLADWPVYLLALAAQFAGDLASSLVRMGLGRGIAPAQQLRSMEAVAKGRGRVGLWRGGPAWAVRVRRRLIAGRARLGCRPSALGRARAR